jgi:hypothetical protein
MLVACETITDLTKMERIKINFAFDKSTIECARQGNTTSLTGSGCELKGWMSHDACCMSGKVIM